MAENKEDFIVEGLEELSEDTKLKMKIALENAITSKVEETTKSLQEQHDAEVAELMEKADEYAQYIVQEMSDKIDNYAQYVVEKFIESHKEQIIESAEYNRMKLVFEKIKSVFEEGYFKLDSDEAVNELRHDLEESRQTYSNLFNEHVDLKKKAEEMEYAIVFESLTADLSDTQKERIQALIENVSFNSIADFKRGIELMKEQVSTVKQSEDISESVELIKEEQEDKPSKMKQYLNHL